MVAIPKYIEPEIKLWRAVLDLAIHDLGSTNIDIREKAAEWFCPLNEDFVFICDLVSLDHNTILNYIEENKAVLTSTDNLKKKVRRLTGIDDD